MRSVVRRILRVTFTAMLAVLLLAAGTLAVLTLTERGRASLASVVSRLASTSARTVTLTDIDGIWSGRLRLGSLAIADTGGTWLALRNVELDWSPMALWSGTFRADRVFAAEAELVRLPEPQQQTEQSSGNGLPVDIAVERLDLPAIALGPEIAGGIARIAARGSLSIEADPLAVDTDLDLSRTDRRPGTAQAEIHFEPALNKLEIDLRASEPAGGVLAKLLRLPGAPAVDLLVSGNGPLSNWSGSGTFAANGVVVTRLSGSHRLNAEGRAVEAKGDGEFARFVPGSVSPLLEGRSSFDVAGLLGEDGVLRIGRAVLSSNTVTATASGQLALRAPNADLAEDGKGDRLQSGAGNAAPPASSDLAVEITAKNADGVPLTLPAGAETARLVLRSASLRALGEGLAPALDLSAEFAEVALGPGKDGAPASLDTVAPAVPGAAPAAAPLRLARDVTAKLHSDAFDLVARTGPISVELAAASLDQGVTAAAPLLSGRVELAASGAIGPDTLVIQSGSLRSDALVASVAGTVALADASFALDVTGDAAVAALPQPVTGGPLGAALGERLALSAHVVRSADGTIAAERLVVESGGLAASGTVRLQGEAGDGQAATDAAGTGQAGTGLSGSGQGDGAEAASRRVELVLSGSLADVGRLLAQVSGSISFMVTASGPLAAPDVALKVTSDKFVAAGREIADLTVSAAGRVDLANPAADLALTGTVAGEALSGSTRLTSTGGVPRLEQLALTLGENRITGAVALKPSAGAAEQQADDQGEGSNELADSIVAAEAAPLGGLVPEGTIAFDLRDIGPIAALGLQEAEGDLAGTATFGAVDGVPQLGIEATTNQLRRGDVTARSASVSATVADYLRAPAVSGRVMAAQIKAAGATIADADVTLSRDAEWTRFDGGATVNTIPAKAAGRVRLADGRTTLELDRASATVQGVDVALTAPTVVGIAGQDITLDNAALSLNGVPATLSGTHRLTDAGRAITASGSGAFADLVPERLRPLLAGTSRFDVTATLGGGGVEIAQAVLQSAAARATASGRLALPGPLDGTPAQPDAAQRAGPDAAGSGDEPGRAGADRAVIPPGPVKGVNDFALEITALDDSGVPLSLPAENETARLVLRSAGLKASGDALAPALDVTADLAEASLVGSAPAGAVRRARDVSVKLHSDQLNLLTRSGSVEVDLAAQSVDVGDARLAPLLAGAVSARLAGQLTPEALVVSSGTLTSQAGSASLSGRIGLADGTLALDVAADVASAAVPAVVPRQVLGDRLELAAKLSRDATGAIEAEQISVSSGGVSAQGRASLSGGILDATITGSIAEVGNVLPQASGAASFSAEANGPVAAPALRLDASSDRLVTAGGEVTGLRLSASGKLDPANPAAEVALSGAVDGEQLSGSARLSTQGHIRRLDDFALTLGENRISGALTLDEALVPEGTLSVDLPDLGPVAALASQQASGDLKGELTLSQVDGKPQARLEATSGNFARADLTGRNVAIAATATDYLGAPVISGTVKAAEIKSGNTTIANADVALLQDGEWTRFEGGATVRGVPAEAAGRLKLAEGAATLELESGAATIGGVETKIGDDAAVSFVDGQVKLDSFPIEFGGGVVQATGTAGATLDLDITIEGLPAQTLDRFAPGIGAVGTISGTAKVTGAAADPKVAFDVDWSGAQVQQTRQAGLPPLTLRSTGTYQGGRLIYDATVGDTGSDDSGLELKSKGTIELQGSRTLDLDVSVAALPASTLDPYMPGASAAGSISGSAKITGQLAAPKAQFDLEWTGAAVDQSRSAGLDPFTIRATGSLVDRRLEFDATAGDGSALAVKATGTVALDESRAVALDATLAGLPAAAANGFLPGLDAAGTVSGSAKLAGSLDAPQGSFALTWTGAQTSQTRAAGFAALDLRANGTVENGRLRFDAKAQGDRGVSVAATGELDVKTRQLLALDATLAGLPAAAANGFVPGLDAVGTVSGSAKLAGSLGNPQGSFALTWTGAQTSHTRAAGFGAMTLKTSGTVENGRLRFDADVGDASGFGLAGGGTVDMRGGRGLDLAFNGTIPFGFLTERLAAQGLTLSGQASVAITVGGTTASPVLGGSISSSGGRLVHAPTGVALGDLQMSVAVAGGVARVTQLSGTLASGGTVSATGTIGVAGGFPADLAIRLAQARYTDGRVVTTTLDGTLTLKGPLAGAPVLSGAIELQKTVITVPERLPGALAELDVKHRNAPADVLRQAAELKPAAPARGGGRGLVLDVTLNAPGQIFARGRGLDAELGGSLKLTGPVSAPQALGQFTLVRGRLAILGRRLSFTSGTLTFSGSLVPYLNLVAESAATDTIVTISVTGPANNPKFVFASVPQLPEDEVLSRLIFGRSMSDLSPIQIAQLAEAAAMLAGVGGKTSLLESLRGQLGVDDLDIKTNAAGETAVSVGKYLNDKTYVTIEAGEGASSRATINLDVGRGVKLRGEAGAQGQAKGGIYYEREY